MVDTNPKQEIEFVAFVGIDWADQKHAWALQIPGHLDVERGDLDHTPEAVEAWAAELARRFEVVRSRWHSSNRVEHCFSCLPSTRT